MKTAEEYEKMAEDAVARQQKRRADQLDGSDCALSDWADGLNMSLYRAKAELARNKGMSEFPALFDLTGERVRAKLINGKFGLCWALCDEADQFVGRFITAFPKREKTMAKKGYREGTEQASANAAIKGENVMACGVVVYRTDKGYPGEAKVS